MKTINQTFKYFLTSLFLKELNCLKINLTLKISDQGLWDKLSFLASEIYRKGCDKSTKFYCHYDNGQGQNAFWQKVCLNFEDSKRRIREL